MYYTKYVINYYNVLAVHLKYLASYALVWAHELKSNFEGNGLTFIKLHSVGVHELK